MPNAGLIDFLSALHIQTDIAVLRRPHWSLGFQTTFPRATSSSTAGSSCRHSMMGFRTKLITGIRRTSARPSKDRQYSLSTVKDRFRKQTMATTSPPRLMISLINSAVVLKLLQMSSTITYLAPFSMACRPKTSFDFSREVSVAKATVFFSAFIAVIQGLSMLSAVAKAYPPIGAPQKTSTLVKPTHSCSLTDKQSAKYFKALPCISAIARLT